MAAALTTPHAESAASMIGHINFDRKPAGKRSAGKPPATFDEAGTGDVAWSGYSGTRRRKGEITVNTNFDLNRRASPRPYLRGTGGEIPPVYSPFLLGLVIGILAIPVALSLSPHYGTLYERKLRAGLKACSWCHEAVHPQATVCRYCGRDLDRGAQSTQSGGPSPAK